MSGPLFLGIDGGGSTLRVAVVGLELETLTTVSGPSANPNLIGHAAAQALIRRCVNQALAQANATPADISAAAIGIAGASNTHSRDWLAQTLKPALPQSLLAPSSDLEIALVGALAQRYGILLLAGTGSAVYGVAPDGAHLQIGGWGYLLGDDGSSYWIGRQLLRHVIAVYDAGAPVERDPLSRRCLNALGLEQPRELIAWLYRRDEAPAARIAGLTRIVIDCANEGCDAAMEILDRAASILVALVAAMRERLDYAEAPLAFAGGLLDNDNYLSNLAAKQLGLDSRPLAQHPPVIGAALLAKMAWSAGDK
ncbi:MAG: hypothetical protein F4X02_01960 [Chloroflexi bacterium]|nr:hypothetical protein [Chloroflexota bacterium]